MSSVTREDLANQATVAQLKVFAAEQGVDISGLTVKADIAAAIANSSDVTDEELASLAGVTIAGGGEASVTETLEETPAEEAPAEETTEEETTEEPEEEISPEDVRSVEAAVYEGELLPPINIEDWVQLGEHENIPERLVGRRAAVLEAPREMIDPEDLEDTWITVRTRDEVNATLHIPLSAVTEIYRNGTDHTVRG